MRSGEQNTSTVHKKKLSICLPQNLLKLNSYPCPYEKGWHLTKN